MRDAFTIRDEDGQDVYYIVGRISLFRRKLSFQDTEGCQLLLIRQKPFSLASKYDILRDGHRFATVRMHLMTFFRTRFTVGLCDGDDLEVRGSFLNYEFQFTRRGQNVATVSKRRFSLADTYGVEIRPGENDVLILASTVVIHLVLSGGGRWRFPRVKRPHEYRSQKAPRRCDTRVRDSLWVA